MAKTYEELLEQAAIVRDETAAGKNTAARVGGALADAVDYVKGLQDFYADIHKQASDAKSTAAAAQANAATTKSTAESAKLIADKNATRILDCQQNIYRLQEGLGCPDFSYKMALGDVAVSTETVTRQEGDEIILDTDGNRFLLQRNGKFYSKWEYNGLLHGSKHFLNRYYTFLNRQDLTYWQYNSAGTLVLGSSTSVAKYRLDALDSACDELQDDYYSLREMIVALQRTVTELGTYASLAALLEAAAAFAVASNPDIAMMHGKYQVSSGRYSSVVITQQVITNSDGSGTAMQYYAAAKARYSRYINFTATGIKAIDGIQQAQYDVPRNLVHSGTLLKMTDMYNNNVGSSVQI